MCYLNINVVNDSMDYNSILVYNSIPIGNINIYYYMKIFISNKINNIYIYYIIDTHKLNNK